jgi:hypothetical protein
VSVSAPATTAAPRTKVKGEVRVDRVGRQQNYHARNRKTLAREFGNYRNHHHHPTIDIIVLFDDIICTVREPLKASSNNQD